MTEQSLYHTYKRYRTVQTHRIMALPIAILMPHSACNCRCIMCDIWKDNSRLRQLSENDLQGLLTTFKKLQTKKVLMSGGEALLNSRFFQLCEILQRHKISVTLLSTGLTLKNHIPKLLALTDEIIVSLDGDETTHNLIRNIPDAFRKLHEGVQSIKKANPEFRITARSVIHRLNFRSWPALIEAAKEMGIDQLSFLPADTSSQAFNRETPWTHERQHEILPAREELTTFNSMVESIIANYQHDFKTHFIAESPDKIRKIYQYYTASHGLDNYPTHKCNAPWVSAVIEADGTVKPCFFQSASGNIHTQSLGEILNSAAAIRFRKNLDIDQDEICKKCVCSLNLPPRMNPATN